MAAYQVMRVDVLHQHFREMICRTRCPLLCHYIVKWYYPDRVMHQFGMVQIIDNKKLHTFERRDGRNWAERNEIYVTSWNEITTIFNNPMRCGVIRTLVGGFIYGIIVSRYLVSLLHTCRWLYNTSRPCLAIIFFRTRIRCRM